MERNNKHHPRYTIQRGDSVSFRGIVMFDLDVSIVDSVWLRVGCERGIAKELADYFTFKVPG